MKRLMVGLLIMGSLGVFLGTARAAATADLLITVTPNGTKSLSLSTGTLAMGPLALGSVNNISSSVTVTNDGTLQCTVGLRVKTDDATWSAATAAAPDAYNLRALFNSSAPGAGSFLANDDVLTGSAVSATGAGGVYSGDQDGSAFVAATTLGLWFKLDMPTTSTVGTQRSFTIEVSAN